MLLSYFSFSALTGGVIFSANRATGVNVPYVLAASALWPIWWLRYTFTEEA